jgi:PAS domain S-box-containing protein
MVMSYVFSLSQTRRFIAILLVIALTGYLCFLLYTQYEAQQELQHLSQSRFIHDQEKDALSMNFFLADRMDDVMALAESRELQFYYENKALGMSMEYGLGASLLAIEDRLKRFRERKLFEKQVLYKRIAYVEPNGRPLVDVSDSKTFPNGRSCAAYLTPHTMQPAFFLDTRDGTQYIVLSKAYVFKDRYVGQLIVWMKIEEVFHHFFDEEAIASLHETVLLFQNQYVHFPHRASDLLPLDALPDPTSIKPHELFTIVLPEKAKKYRRLQGYLTPVGSTPFALMTFFVTASDAGAPAPRIFIFLLGGFGALIIGGSVYFFRMMMQNAVLQTRLEETALREKIIAEKNASLRQLSSAVEQSSNGVVVLKPDGRIEYANPFYLQLTGAAADEVINHVFSTTIACDNHEEIFNDMRTAINKGNSWSSEICGRRKGGGSYWVQMNISPVRDENGIITNYIAILADITERKKAEAEIKRLNAELEQRVIIRTAELEASNQRLADAYSALKAAQSTILQQEKMASIGQLAAGIAHEVNNPIGYIMSNLNTLNKYLDKKMEYLKHLENVLDLLPVDHQRALCETRNRLKIDYIMSDLPKLIRESIDGTERIRRIVQDLKSFSRVDTSGRKLADLNEQIELTLAIVQHELKYKAVLKKNYGILPEIECNVGQINQVFLNIIINAIQAMETPGEISIRTWLEAPDVYVEIKDSGEGIPPEVLDHIFEPFFTTKEVGQGTGLGLSIVYDIIKKHNGDIRVCSDVGVGTTFTIRLPIRSHAVMKMPEQ